MGVTICSCKFCFSFSGSLLSCPSEMSALIRVAILGRTDTGPSEPWPSTITAQSPDCLTRVSDLCRAYIWHAPLVLARLEEVNFDTVAPLNSSSVCKNQLQNQEWQHYYHSWLRLSLKKPQQLLERPQAEQETCQSITWKYLISRSICILFGVDWTRGNWDTVENIISLLTFWCLNAENTISSESNKYLLVCKYWRSRIT